MGVRSISGRPESEYTNEHYSSASGLTGSEAEEAGNLPDRHRSLHMPLAPLEGKKLSKSNNTKALVMSDELHDYSEIYTPSNENAAVAPGTGWGGLSTDPESSLSAGDSSGGGRAGSGDSGLTGLSSGTTAGDIVLEGPPPPRPLHRYPSWEDRIYQLACEGVGSETVVRRDGNRRDCGSNRNSAVLSAGYGNEISVPVYATVKGVRVFDAFYDRGNSFFNAPVDLFAEGQPASLGSVFRGLIRLRVGGRGAGRHRQRYVFTDGVVDDVGRPFADLAEERDHPPDRLLGGQLGLQLGHDLRYLGLPDPLQV